MTLRISFGDPEARARRKEEKERKKQEELAARLARKRMEFSKKILLVSSVFFGAVMVYAAWIQYLIISKDYMGDTSITLAMLTAVGAEVSAGVSFYYWKAKAENLERERRKTSSLEYSQGQEEDNGIFDE